MENRQKAMMKFLDGATPREKGFFLESRKDNGFFPVPADRESNKRRIFVITSAANDVATRGG